MDTENYSAEKDGKGISFQTLAILCIYLKFQGRAPLLHPLPRTKKTCDTVGFRRATRINMKPGFPAPLLTKVPTKLLTKVGSFSVGLMSYRVDQLHILGMVIPCHPKLSY